MKMKKLLSLLTAAALSATCAVGFATGASAATVDDLVPISTSMTYWFDNATSNGTEKVAANTLFGGGYFFTSTGNDKSNAKGSVTVDGVKHLNSLRIKNTQDKLVFKTAKDCDITLYTQSHGSRGTVVTSSDLTSAYPNHDAAVDGGAVAVQSASTSELKYSATGNQTHYLSSYGGDFYLAGIKVDVKSTDPSISVSPMEKTISIGETFTISPTTSNIGDASVVWSSDNDAVASVDNGVVTGVAAGTTKINATVTVGGRDYSASCDVTVVDNVTITYSKGDVEVEGNAPAAETVVRGTNVTIPKNDKLYAEGKTLTKWTDGENYYVPGQVYALNDDMTVTPVFEDNSATLGDAATTVNYTFRRDEGATVFAYEGNQGIIVGQANIDGKVIDVKMDINTKPGKFNNSGSKEWAQVNAGTTFTVSVLKGSVVTVGDVYDENTQYTVNGVEKYNDNGYETADSDGTMDIVSINGTYWRGISVTYPKVIKPQTTVVKQAVFEEGTTNPAVAFKGTVTPGTNTVKKLTWSVSQGAISESQQVSLSGEANYVYGLVVVLESDEAKAAGIDAVSAELLAE